MKFLFRRLVLLILMLVLVSSNIVQAKISGERRGKFIEVTEIQCFRNQYSRPENISFSTVQIKNYCKCMASYVADRVSNSEAEYIESDKETRYIAIIQKGAKSCGARM